MKYLLLIWSLHQNINALSFYLDIITSERQERGDFEMCIQK